MEQDRAPIVFLHQSELARQALGEPRGDCEFDFSDNYSDQFKGAGRTRHQLLPARSQGIKKQIEEINIRPDSFHGEWVCV